MCRSFLTPNYVNPETGKAEFYGRGNIGVTTINLADVALSAQKKCKELGYTPVNESPQVFDQEDMEKFFWPLLEERTELCHDAQKVRFYRLLDTPADVNPILWCDGALSRLDQDEKIGKTIINKHFSSSLGYTGLYETSLVITGKSHTDPIGREFALRVMQFLNDQCLKWRKQEPIDYSVYGTPKLSWVA